MQAQRSVRGGESEGVGAWWGRRGDEMEEGAVVALQWPSDAM
jgi:hypothetical protein